MRSAGRTVLTALGILGGCVTALGTTDAWIPCAFVPFEQDRDRISHCARRVADRTLSVEPHALDVLASRGRDPAPVTFAGTLHYLNASGIAVPVLPFDNGPDDFVEGLARTVRDGKIGFIDEALAVVIPPNWDFAFPFEKGCFVVCNGCTSGSPDEDGHREIFGGLWGTIDARGEVVVPLVHSRQALQDLLHP
jgi:hypothetical protein